MDPLVCEQCTCNLFTVTRGFGTIPFTCTKCAMSYYLTLEHDRYPFPAPVPPI